MTPEIEAKKKRRAMTKGLKPDGLSYRLALLEVGDVMLQEMEQKTFNRMRDRVNLATVTRALTGRQFHCSLLHCRDLADPTEATFIMRVKRLPNALKGPEE